MSKVTVITATVANPLLSTCVESVAKQTHKDIQHLLIADGVYVRDAVDKEIIYSDCKYVDRINLPYSIGKDRWNGHRIYAAGSYIAEGDYIMFLDDDNYLEPDHIESCLKAIEGKDWVFSFRRIVDKHSNFVCDDNCESLGMWASVLHPQDFFVDVNCFFVRRNLAVGISPLWFRKFREPGQPEIDRVLTAALRGNNLKFDSTYKYTVNYTVGNTPNSVQKEFFLNGNAEMLRRYENKLPWIK
jgi:GT2 family glycosyltransferase